MSEPSESECARAARDCERETERAGDGAEELDMALGPSRASAMCWMI